MIYLIYVDGIQMLWTEDYFKYDAACQAAIATARMAGFKYREISEVQGDMGTVRLLITRD